MAHMIPQYSNAPFVMYEDEYEETFFVPKGLEPPDAEATRAPKGWYHRLSAPGYMDCTAWSGPFETELEAVRDLLHQYEVDPRTGDDLPDDYTDTPGPICGAVGCSCWSANECAEHAEGAESGEAP